MNTEFQYNGYDQRVIQKELNSAGESKIHASLDNQILHVRLATDTDYELASEEVDERWVGENSIGHCLARKRGRIC